MELQEIQREFKSTASILGEYELMTKTKLANGYCDAEEKGNQLLRSAYWAALMLRYWFRIYEWIDNCKSLRLRDEEFVDWLHESLMDAFYYRSWRWEYKAVVRHGKFIEWKLDSEGHQIPNEFYWKKDPNAPDKSINYFCGAKRGKMYQYYNKQVRKGNVVSTSLDSALEAKGDCIYNKFTDYVVDMDTDGIDKYFINYFLKSNRVIEALIIDGILHQDTFKVYKEKKSISIPQETGEVVDFTYISRTEEFNARMLVKYLKDLKKDFVTNYFCTKYSIPVDKVMKGYNKLKTLNSPELYKMISNTLNEIKEDKNLMSAIK